MKIKLVSFDPALQNLGVAWATFDTDTGEIAVTGLNLVKTDGQAGKTVRKNSDDLRRAKLLHDGMKEACEEAAIAMAEVPVGSQSARAMASYGVCVGVLAGCPLPLIEVTPTEAKVAATGQKTATKGEMIAWATKKYPKAPWRLHRGKLTNDNEHLADAVAVFHAGVKTPEFKAAIAFMRSVEVSHS